jgi:subtilisin
LPKRTDGPARGTELIRTTLDSSTSGLLAREVAMRARIAVVLLAQVMALTTGMGGAAAAAGGGEYIVVLKDGAIAEAVAASHGRKYGVVVSHVYSHSLRGYAAHITSASRAALESDPTVMFVSEDREARAAVQTLPTGVDRIDGDQSSTLSGNGSGSVDINIGIIDSGIDLDHPDLNVVGGVNCSSGKSFDDGFGHGTHTAGVVGARDNGIGIVGVAPGARLWAIRVLGNGGRGNDASVICGIDWVASTLTDSDPTNDIRLVNMSVIATGLDDGNCGRSNKDAEHLAICNATAAGVTFVVAAGNNSGDLAGFVPSAYDEVLAVSSMTDYDGQAGALASPAGSCVPPKSQNLYPDDTASGFSNFAMSNGDRARTVAGPGVCILSTAPGGGYDTESGTSFASPHVAGTVALCMLVGACVGTPAQIIQKIVADAAAYNTGTGGTGYGFAGDPLRPIAGKYYGYLIHAGSY